MLEVVEVEFTIAYLQSDQEVLVVEVMVALVVMALITKQQHQEQMVLVAVVEEEQDKEVTPQLRVMVVMELLF